MFCESCGAPSGVPYPVLTCRNCSRVSLVNLDEIKRAEREKQDAEKAKKGPDQHILKLTNALKVMLLDKNIRAFLDKNDPKAVEQATKALAPFEPTDEFKDEVTLSRMDCYAGKQRAEVNAYDPELQLEDGIDAPPYVWLQFVEGCGYTVYTVTPDEAEDLAVMLFNHAQIARKRYEHRHDMKPPEKKRK